MCSSNKKNIKGISYHYILNNRNIKDNIHYFELKNVLSYLKRIKTGTFLLIKNSDYPFI